MKNTPFEYHSAPKTLRKWLNISGGFSGRDLWSHTDLGQVSDLNLSVAPHGCRIIKLSKTI